MQQSTSLDCVNQKEEMKQRNTTEAKNETINITRLPELKGGNETTQLTPRMQQSRSPDCLNQKEEMKQHNTARKECWLIPQLGFPWCQKGESTKMSTILQLKFVAAIFCLQPLHSFQALHSCNYLRFNHPPNFSKDFEPTESSPSNKA